MTAAAQTPYTIIAGSGTNGPFAVPFRFLANTDLVVEKVDADGVRTTLSDNTITGAGEADGGELYTDADVETGETLVIYRGTPLTQTAAYIANGAFPAATHELALDRLVLQIQDVRRDADRGLVVPMGEEGQTLGPAADRAGKMIEFDDDGDLQTTRGFDEIVTAAGALVGAEALALVAAAGDTEEANVIAQGDTQETRIEGVGDAEVDDVEAAGTVQLAALITATASHVNTIRLTAGAQMYDDVAHAVSETVAAGTYFLTPVTGGFQYWKMDVGGATATEVGPVMPDITFADTTQNTNYERVDKDSGSAAIVGVIRDDIHLAYAGSSKRISMGDKDRELIAISAGVMTRKHKQPIPLWNKDFNVVEGAGQSLMESTSCPGINTAATAVDGALMVGSSMNPAVTGGDILWTPTGSGAFNPAASVNGGLTITSANVEHMLVAALREIQRGVNEAGRGVRTVGGSTAVGSMTIEQISPGGVPPTPEYWQKKVAFHTLVKSLADAGSGGYDAGTSQVIAQWLANGESNSQSSEGGDITYAGFKALLGDYRDASNALYATTYGQTRNPAMFLSQVSGHWLQTESRVDIAQAQLDFALETPGVWCMGPFSQVGDKVSNGSHPDANGHAWSSAIAGKIMRHVLVDGLDWQPLHPLWIEVSGHDIYIGWFVPRPPLAYRIPYRIGNQIELDDWGVQVYDDVFGKKIPIVETEIVGACITRHRCLVRPDPSTAYVLHAGPFFGGQGHSNIADSDNSLSTEVYTPVNSMFLDTSNPEYPEGNIGALENQPYPLFNFASPFERAVGWSRL